MSLRGGRSSAPMLFWGPNEAISSSCWRLLRANALAMTSKLIIAKVLRSNLPALEGTRHRARHPPRGDRRINSVSSLVEQRAVRSRARHDRRFDSPRESQLEAD